MTDPRPDRARPHLTTEALNAIKIAQRVDTEHRHRLGTGPQVTWADGAVEWAPAPSDIPRWRREMVDYTHTGLATQLALHAAINGMGATIPAATPQDSARLFLDQERARLSDADLFYVAPEMVDLVLAAYASMPEYAPRAADIPATSGFIVFGKPLTARPLLMSEVDFALDLMGPTAAARLKEGTHETPIVAAAWGPYDGGTPLRRRIWNAGGGVFINFYAPGGVSLSGLDKDTARRARALLPPLSGENEAAFALLPDPGVPLPRGMTEALYRLRENEPNDRSGALAADGTAVSGQTGPWARMLLACFTLMMQPGLATETTEKTPRQQRRRDERDGVAPRDVRIIHLRRAAPPAETTQPGPTGERATREFHVQWLVRGHWRQQAHGPGRSLRKPKWIAPHVKGPDDKPFIGGEKVNVWDK